MLRTRRLCSKLLLFFTTGTFLIISQYNYEYVPSSSSTDFKENVRIDSITRTASPILQQDKKDDAFVENRKDSINTNGAQSIFKNFPSPMRIAIEETKKYLRVNHVDTIHYNRSVIFVVTSWRSGSTFFGEMFSSHPAIFYHYEPLARFGFKDLSSEENMLNEAITDIDNLSECKYEKLIKYLEYAKNDSNIFKLNSKIDRGCEYIGESCFLPTFPKLMCNMFPVKVFKILRVNASHLKKFLKSKSFHIILLVRDPRATFASRRKLNWCTDVKICMDMEHHCKVMSQNFFDTDVLKSIYPGQVHLVRYEDVADNPIVEFKKIFQKVDIPWHSFVQRTIEYHTKKEINVPWSTYRISKTRIDKWKTELKPDMISYVESKCRNILALLDYPLNATKLCANKNGCAF